MRIDAYSKVNQIYQTSRKVKQNSITKSSATDQVEISQFGREYQAVKQAVASAPDVREDKVANVKSQIAAGTYNITPGEFASKLAEKYQTSLL